MPTRRGGRLRSASDARALAAAKRVTARLLKVLAATALVVAGLAIAHPVAAHAATTTINCDTVSQKSSDWKECRKLAGTSSCAWNNGDGTWTFALGYTTPTAENLYASIPDGSGGGANNSLSATNGSASASGQVSTFYPGTSQTAFTVTWSPQSKTDTLTWDLMGHQYEFTELSQPACTAKPVPILGSFTVVGGALLFLVVAFVAVNRRRVAKLRRTPWLHEA